MQSIIKLNTQKLKCGFPGNITLSGEVASGKSSVGKCLAEILGYQFTSVGDRTRQVAENMGLTIPDFQKMCLKDSSVDKRIDAEFSHECASGDRLVIDYRLGYKFITDAFHIFLDVSENEAVNRLRVASRKLETWKSVRDRNNLIKKQFLAAYNEDFLLTDNYDLILSSQNFSNSFEAAQFISNLIKHGADI